MELRYAECFGADFYEDGCVLVTVRDEGKYLLVPAAARQGGAGGTSGAGGTAGTGGTSGAAGIPKTEQYFLGADDVTVLHLPLKDIYVADSAAVDLFSRLGALDAVRYTSTKREDWALDAVREALDRGALNYVGKYNAPDYEALLEEGCGLAVENTMIYHSPETKEQLERLGIPVLVARASYETHPLGRLEWIRLYGLLTGKEEEAERFFSEQVQAAEALTDDAVALPGASEGTEGPEAESTQGAEAEKVRTAAFFYISPNGYVNVRRPEDYVPKMIEMAGGRYVFQDLAEEQTARSTMNMQAETFYAEASDADVLIYNATVDGGIRTRQELISKAEWLADFRAVQEGNVWCTEQNMFQQTSGIAEMIGELKFVLEGSGETELRYFYRLE